jgi:hypothetical protein
MTHLITLHPINFENNGSLCYDNNIALAGGEHG